MWLLPCASVPLGLGKGQRGCCLVRPPGNVRLSLLGNPVCLPLPGQGWGTEGPGFRLLRAPPAQSPWQEATRMWWVANRMGRRVQAVLGHRLDGPLSRESRKPLLRNEVRAMVADLVSCSSRESRMLPFRDKDPLKAMRIIKDVPLET